MEKQLEEQGSKFTAKGLTLLHSERPKLCRVLAVLSATGLSLECFLFMMYLSHILCIVIVTVLIMSVALLR